MLTKTMQILLSTDFKIGDVVGSIINKHCDEDSSLYFIVCGYDINGVDETGMVTSYFIKVIGQGGEVLLFPPESIEHKKE